MPSLPALECFEKPNEWAMSRALFANSWLLTASEMSDDVKLIAYKGLITYCPKSKMVLIARCIYVETSNYVFRTDNPLSYFGPMQTSKNYYINTLYICETMMKVISWGKESSKNRKFSIKPFSFEDRQWPLRAELMILSERRILQKYLSCYLLRGYYLGEKNYRQWTNSHFFSFSFIFFDMNRGRLKKALKSSKN